MDKGSLRHPPGITWVFARDRLGICQWLPCICQRLPRQFQGILPMSLYIGSKCCLQTLTMSHACSFIYVYICSHLSNVYVMQSTYTLHLLCKCNACARDHPCICLWSPRHLPQIALVSPRITSQLAGVSREWLGILPKSIPMIAEYYFYTFNIFYVCLCIHICIQCVEIVGKGSLMHLPWIT